MNGPEPEPLSPDLVDELLSAELDDEFDAAARELGLEPATARARLAATPGVEQRRAALARAQAFVASDEGDALDDVTRRRLVSRALDGAPPLAHHTAHHRARTWTVRAGALAGAAAALVGVIVLLGHSGGGEGAKSSGAAIAAAPATPPTTVAPPAANHSFAAAGSGASSVDSGAQLNQFVQGLLHSKYLATPSAKATAAPSENGPLQRSDSPGTTVAPTCAGRISQVVEIHSSPIATASVTYKGQPARLAVFNTEFGPLAVVYDPSKCTVLARQLVK
jgi:hypothetical protein